MHSALGLERLHGLGVLHGAAPGDQSLGADHARLHAVFGREEWVAASRAVTAVKVMARCARHVVELKGFDRPLALGHLAVQRGKLRLFVKDAN